MINNKQIQGFLIPYYFFKLQFLNPLMHNVPKWSDTLWKSYSIFYKIFKICVTILGHYVLKG